MKFQKILAVVDEVVVETVIVVVAEDLKDVAEIEKKVEEAKEEAKAEEVKEEVKEEEVKEETVKEVEEIVEILVLKEEVVGLVTSLVVQELEVEDVEVKT